MTIINLQTNRFSIKEFKTKFSSDFDSFFCYMNQSVKFEKKLPNQSIKDMQQQIVQFCLLFAFISLLVLVEVCLVSSALYSLQIEALALIPFTASRITAKSTGVSLSLNLPKNLCVLR